MERVEGRVLGPGPEKSRDNHRGVGQPTELVGTSAPLVISNATHEVTFIANVFELIQVGVWQLVLLNFATISCLSYLGSASFMLNSSAFFPTSVRWTFISSNSNKQAYNSSGYYVKGFFDN